MYRFVKVTLLVALIVGMLPLFSNHSMAAPIRYEAEQGTLSGVSVSTAVSGYSGSGYVTGFDNASDYLSLQVNAPSRAVYTLSVRYRSASGDKVTGLVVNGTSFGDLSLRSSNVFTEVSAGKILLNAGANTIRFNNGWGYYDIDAIILDVAPTPPPHNLSRTLVNPNATAAAKSLFNYIADQYGNHILSGQQTLSDANWIGSNIGKRPALVGFDMIDYSPTRVQNGATSNEVENAISWDQQKGIVAFTWHWNAPKNLINQPGKEWWRGFYTDSTTFDLQYALNNPSSQDYQYIIRDIDAIAVQLKRLQDANIPVLWRPLHEAEGGWFWWGAKGAEPCKQLYRLMYDRLTNYHHLNNLIWVWNSESPDWYPGDAYVDIGSTDMYATAGDYSALSSKYESVKNLVQDRKPVALAENGPIPDPALLQLYRADWSWFMTWTGGFINDGVQNSRQHLIDVYNNAYVITLDKLPSNLKTYGSTGATLYGFESGIDGWIGTNVAGGPWTVTEWSAAGTRSLKSDVALAAGASYSLSKVAVQNFSGKTTLKATVKHAAWGTIGSGMTAKLFVKSGSSYTWYDSGSVAINSTGGTTLTLSLSGVANLSDIREIGVQFISGSGSSGGTSIYVDQVTIQ